jgi:DNA 3'-phosphatase
MRDSVVILWFALLAAACQSGSATPGADGAPEDQADAAGAGGEVDAAWLPLPTVRQDLSGWACRAGGGAQPVAFLDADSTLRISKSGSVTPDNAGDVDILPFAAEKIAELDGQGYLAAIVSNQGGIRSGYQTLADAQAALAATVAELGSLGGRIPYFDFAENYDEYRKPMTGMATRLDGLLVAACGAGVDLGQSLMIGDFGYKVGVDGPSPDGRPADDYSNTDRLFAENLGVAFFEPTDAFDWRAFSVYNIGSVADLRAFLDAIEAEAVRLDGTGEDPTRAASLHHEVTAIRAADGL